MGSLRRLGGLLTVETPSHQHLDDEEDEDSCDVVLYGHWEELLDPDLHVNGVGTYGCRLGAGSRGSPKICRESALST